MGKYHNLAKNIIKEVGGKDNIDSVTNCITRLRFKLKDESKANDDAINNMDDVVTVRKAGGQYQVVIGNNVADVRADVDDVLGIVSSDISAKPTGNLFDQFVDIVSSIFMPVIMPLSAAGMLKGLVSILSFALGTKFSSGSTYAVLNAMSDSLFLFLPMFIGYTSMKKFRGSPFVGMMIAATLVYPGFVDGSITQTFAKTGGLALFGLHFSVPLSGYGTTVMPIIASTFFAAFLERQLRKLIPDVVKEFLVPFFTILIAVPLVILIIGPCMNVASDWILQIFKIIQNFNPIIFGAVMGFTWQILVMFGLHWALVPIWLVSVTSGNPTLLLAGAGSLTFAQTGAAIGVMAKTKNPKLRQQCIPAIISGIFGVTEPAIYGVTLPKKKPFWISCAVGAITGAIAMSLKIYDFTMSGMGIFRYTSNIPPSGALNLVIYSVILDIFAILACFILTWIIGFSDDVPNSNIITKHKDKTKEQLTNHTTVYSPVSGDVLSLEDSKDDTFQQLGEGTLIKPKIGEVVAPFDGQVITLFPTLHAIGLISNTGVELLIHIGIDTVELNGKYFETFVHQGDSVTRGQKLIKFDIPGIEKAGFDSQVPIIVTNSQNYSNIKRNSNSQINFGEKLITLEGTSKNSPEMNKKSQYVR